MAHNCKDDSESRRGGTQTSAFGTPGRINHDASEFYGSRLYADQEFLEPDEPGHLKTLSPSEDLDRLYCTSSTDYVRNP